MQVLIIDPCRINGQHQDTGAIIEVEDTVAMDLVSASRGTINENRIAAAQAAEQPPAKPK